MCGGVLENKLPEQMAVGEGQESAKAVDLWLHWENVAGKIVGGSKPPGPLLHSNNNQVTETNVLEKGKAMQKCIKHVA